MKNRIFLYLLIILLFPGDLFSQQIKVACIGNSITYGSGMPDPATMSYPAQLQYWMGKDYEVRNFGVGGATLLRNGNKPYWKQQAYTNALEFKPDIVIIKLGTNDSKPQNWSYSDEFAQDYLDMIQSFKNLSSRPRVILALPVPVFTKEKWGIRDSIVSEEVIPKVREIAGKSGCEIVDLYTPLLESGQLFPDQIHPDPIGASLMTELIYRKLFHKTAENGGGYFNPCTHPVPSFEYRSGAGWGDGNYWMSQHQDINNIGENRKARLVFLGNSITQGWGGEGREVWSPVKELWDSLYQPLQAANFGISGDRTQHVLWRINNGNFDKIKPELIVVAIGVNNFRHNSAKEIAEGISAIVTRLKKKAPTSSILLQGPFPAGATQDDPLRVTYREVHRLISPLGKLSNVTYKNIGPEFIQEDGSLDYSLMREDNIHLAPKGYYKWAESIQKEVDKAFSGK